MATSKCTGCGHMTDTRVSMVDGKEIVQCYARISTANGKWEKGCAYDEASAQTLTYINYVLLGEQNENDDRNS